MELRDLKCAEFIGLFGIRFEQPEFSSLAQRDEFAVGQNGGPAPINRRLRLAAGGWMTGPTLVAAPIQDAGLEIDTAEGGVRLIAPAEGVEMAMKQHRRVPVNLQNCRCPLSSGRVALEGRLGDLPGHVKSSAVRFHAEQLRPATIV